MTNGKDKHIIKVPYDTFIKRVTTIRPKVGQSDVDAFLSEVREAIAQTRCIFHGSKAKNMDTLTKLGFTFEDMYEEICTLTYKNYLYGPEQDRRPGHEAENIWVFKKPVKGMLVYIKLEIIVIAKRTLVVLSFHEDNAA